MARRRSSEREQFWRDLIERQPASGLSIARICQQAGVSANSFYVWKRRLRPQIGRSRRAKPTSRSGALLRSTQSAGPAPAGSSLVPVRIIADPVHHHAPQDAVIEVQWPDGLVLRVPASCDGRVIRDLLKALAPLLVGDRASC
jgi:transposase-like protein